MLPRKVINLHHENRLKNEGNIINALKKIDTNKNLDFCFKEGFLILKKILRAWLIFWN